uniref:Uncharacterized protein n=1 Tax=Candidatus Kentrum sp. TC TaxID=2126339 RepID=A0A450ZZ15_9GAMM|nr:MAG: hypothetical protein BECKTC1821F_GA0114240_102821 [Candidatus Kentron sp. TC]
MFKIASVVAYTEYLLLYEPIDSTRRMIDFPRVLGGLSGETADLSRQLIGFPGQIIESSGQLDDFSSRIDGLSG